MRNKFTKTYPKRKQHDQERALIVCNNNFQPFSEGATNFLPAMMTRICRTKRTAVPLGSVISDMAEPMNFA
jgi:hypothetical protein